MAAPVISSCRTWSGSGLRRGTSPLIVLLLVAWVGTPVGASPSARVEAEWSRAPGASGDAVLALEVDPRSGDVFTVRRGGRLARLDQASGSPVWTRDLPKAEGWVHGPRMRTRWAERPALPFAEVAIVPEAGRLLSLETRPAAEAPTLYPAMGLTLRDDGDPNPIGFLLGGETFLVARSLEDGRPLASSQGHATWRDLAALPGRAAVAMASLDPCGIRCTPEPRGLEVSWQQEGGRFTLGARRDTPPIRALSASVDGRWLAAVHPDSVQVWDMDTQEPLPEIGVTLADPARARFVPGAPRLVWARSARVEGGADRVWLEVFDVLNRRTRRLGSPLAQGERVTGLAVSSDGRTAALTRKVGEAQVVDLVDLPSGATMATLPLDPRADPRPRFLPDGRRLALVGYDGEATVSVLRLRRRSTPRMQDRIPEPEDSGPPVDPRPRAEGPRRRPALPAGVPARAPATARPAPEESRGGWLR